MRLESVGVIEALDRGDLPSNHAVEVRSDHRRAAFIEGVAHFAQSCVGLALLRVSRSEQLVDLRATPRSLTGRLFTFGWLLLRTRCRSASSRGLRQRGRVVVFGAQEDEHVGALLGVGQAGIERHLGTRDECARVVDHMVDLLVIPVAEFGSLRLERLGIFVALMRCDLPAEHAIEVRSDHVRTALIEVVANLALLRDICSVRGVGTRKQRRKVGAALRRLLLFGFLLGDLGLVLLEGNIDDRPRAEEQQQGPQHGHRDLI
jgi:hypothetical protein